MDNDLISRSALKESIDKFHQKENDRLHNPLWDSIGLNALNRLIDYAPTFEKRPQGKWKDITPNHYFTCGGEPLVICPFCGDQESKHVQGIENHMWNFCPNCGADMREADNGTR